MKDIEVTIKQAAKLSGHSEKNLRYWCQAGLLPARRIGPPRRGYWLINNRALAAFKPPERGRPAADAETNWKVRAERRVWGSPSLCFWAPELLSPPRTVTPKHPDEWYRHVAKAAVSDLLEEARIRRMRGY